MVFCPDHGHCRSAGRGRTGKPRARPGGDQERRAVLSPQAHHRHPVRGSNGKCQGEYRGYNEK